MSDYPGPERRTHDRERRAHGLDRRSDVTEATAGDLVTEVRNLTIEVRNEKRLRRIVTAIGAALILLSFVVGVGGVVFSRRVEKVANDDADRSLGLLVAICGIQNVGRIETKNMLTDLERSGLLVHGASDMAKAEEFFDTGHKRFGDVDCRAFVPKKDQVNIELRYPDEETVEGGPTFGPTDTVKK